MSDRAPYTDHLLDLIDDAIDTPSGLGRAASRLNRRSVIVLAKGATLTIKAIWNDADALGRPMTAETIIARTDHAHEAGAREQAASTAARWLDYRGS